MQKLKSQTIKFWTINGFSTSTVSVHKISTLRHELYFFWEWGVGEEKYGIYWSSNLQEKVKKKNAPLEWFYEKDSPHTQIHAGQ